MTSMCVLGLRPITLLSPEESEEWGNDSIDVLIKHFGQKHLHQYQDPETKQNVIVESEPIIDPEATAREWTQVKHVVRVQGYPRNSTSEIWGLLKQYHEEEFPNLIKLSAVALTHPVHTSDCERAFSAQNNVTTPLRNRLSPEHCDQLMRVMLEGPPITKFNYISALKQWRLKKTRAIFK